jgi:2-polyprenyl-6-hydroxyphenyl methylase/3-demethylubiquinone-9 3-methyltransferase
MTGYYDEKLSALKLKRCYEIAPARIRQYLEAELGQVLSKLNADSIVLEMGCGYGRIMPALAEEARHVTGIDTSTESLALAAKALHGTANCSLAAMDASRTGFRGSAFDVVVCIQNGISAFHVDQQRLIREAVRVTKPGGAAMFSSYSDDFWDDRLRWFELQAGEGLLGEIDYEETRDGVIVCRDGFTATTVRADQFQELTEGLNAYIKIYEVDRSSVFCEITPL